MGVEDSPAPPLLKGSVVYVLLLKDGTIYVGETDDLVGRMVKHKVKIRAHKYLVVPLGRGKSGHADKSSATELEKYVIHGLEGMGYSSTNEAKGMR